MIPQTTTAFTHLLITLTLFAVGITFGFVLADDARGQEPKAKTSVFFEPFKGEPDQSQRIQLWGAEAEQFVQFEPTGLRITMPAGFARERPHTGINTTVAVQGDFEITVSYEILQAPEQVDWDKPSMKLILMAVLDRKQVNPAVLARIQKAEGEPQFSTYVTLTDKETGQKKVKGAKQFPAQAKSGKLRLVRNGDILSSYVLEAPETEFRYLKQFSFPVDDLKFVRVLATTGGAKASLDVRFSDLRIRWGNLENDPDVAGQDPAARGAFWPLAAALLIGLVITFLLALALGAWLYLRRGRAAVETESATLIVEEHTEVAPASSHVAVTCSACGKNLKISAEMTGTKVQCAHCGKKVTVSPAGTTQS